MTLQLNNGKTTLNDNGDVITTGNMVHKAEYRDEYPGGEWQTPSGAAAPGAEPVTIGGVATIVLSFDGVNTEERKSNMFEINHDVDIDGLNAETVKLEWHVHFMPSDNAAGDVKWFFDYCYIPANGAPIAQTSISCIKAIAINQQYYHLLCGEELPKPASGFNIGDVILFTLRRTPTDGDDTYEADALLLKTALHVPIDMDGSRERYIK
jgi:hypothetical protein